MQRNLKCLIIEPNKLPYEKVLPNNLKSKQEAVRGYIEYAYLEDREDVCLICNEEGKLLCMEPNRSTGYDIICGPIVLVGYDIELGEDRSLTKDQVKFYKNYFGKKSISDMENHLLAIQIKKQRNMEI